ncbi:MAG: hypothetical protein ACLP7F_10335 [Acidimicrobiales bacterium]
MTQGTDTTVEGARLEDIEWQLDPATVDVDVIQQPEVQVIHHRAPMVLSTP